MVLLQDSGVVVVVDGGVETGNENDQVIAFEHQVIPVVQSAPSSESFRSETQRAKLGG